MEVLPGDTGGDPYVIDGYAKDQETIIRHREWIEEFVRENLEVEYEYSKLFWNKSDDSDQFIFRLEFHKE